MIGKIFITSSGYDPEAGKHVKDPYLGPGIPSLGACRPDVRRRMNIGDHLFFISGKVPGIEQFVMGGFAVAEKISAREAFRRFPERRLRLLEDGQLEGNVVVDRAGRRHKLDTHNPSERAFSARVENYIVGGDAVVLDRPEEIDAARRGTLDFLAHLFGREARRPIELVGRWGASLDHVQVRELRAWLESLKRAA